MLSLLPTLKRAIIDDDREIGKEVNAAEHLPWQSTTSRERTVYGFVSIGSVAVLWLLLTWSGSVSPLFLPGPENVYAQLQNGPSLSQWAWDLVASNLRVIGGFLVAAALALPLGIAVGAIPRISGFFLPLIEMTRYVPVPALLPLCILWAGVGELEKVLVIILGTAFQLAIAVSFAVHAVPRGFVEAGLTLGLGKWEILKKIVVPSAFPLIYDALRVSFAWAWSYLVVAEIIGASAGIGYRLMASQRYLQTGLVFIGIAELAVLGWLADFAFRKLRRVVLPWMRY
jgi:NitT/TauT family transport system permease protein